MDRPAERWVPRRRDSARGRGPNVNPGRRPVPAPGRGRTRFGSRGSGRRHVNQPQSATSPDEPGSDANDGSMRPRLGPHRFPPVLAHPDLAAVGLATSRIVRRSNTEGTEGAEGHGGREPEGADAGLEQTSRGSGLRRRTPRGLPRRRGRSQGARRTARVGRDVACEAPSVGGVGESSIDRRRSAAAPTRRDRAVSSGKRGSPSEDEPGSVRGRSVHARRPRRTRSEGRRSRAESPLVRPSTSDLELASNAGRTASTRLKTVSHASRSFPPRKVEGPESTVRGRDWSRSTMDL